MARIRTIKPEFWSSEQVMECSPIARLLFVGLWNFCDDGGNHVDSEKTIKAEIFPADDISTVDVRRLLDELSSNSLIIRYTSSGKGFIHVTGWHHQKIDRPTFKHPAFPGDDSASARRGIGEESPPEGKGREGKGEELDPSPSAQDSSSASPKTDLLGKPPVDLTERKAARLAAVTEDAIEAYNRLLARPNGKLASVSSVGRKTRQKEVGRMLAEASEICQHQFGDKRITPAFWQAYFEACADDPFCNGTGPYTGEHSNWRPDFEYLTRPKTAVKVFEKSTQAVA